MASQEVETTNQRIEMQLKSVLAVTKTINNNASEEALFDLYETFIDWDLNPSKMQLLVRKGNKWHVATSKDDDRQRDIERLVPHMLKYKKVAKLDDPFLLDAFDGYNAILPVYHKGEPLAYGLFKSAELEVELEQKMSFVQTLTNIISVAIENKRMVRQEFASERFAQSAELAVQVQDMFLPKRFPSNDYYTLDGIYQPQMKVGGDYFNYLELNDNKLLFCIADISGKGVGAAMVMANFHAQIEFAVKQFDNLKDVVHHLNKAVFELTDGDKFVSLFIAYIDPNVRRLNYINAGHCRPALIDEQGVRFLGKGTTLLGIVPELPAVELGQLNYAADATIISYTDGLTELRNADGVYFDEDYLLSFAYGIQSSDIKKINASLLKRLDQFKGRKEYDDDIAILTCKLY